MEERLRQVYGRPEQGELFGEVGTEDAQMATEDWHRFLHGTDGDNGLERMAQTLLEMRE